MNTVARIVAALVVVGASYVMYGSAVTLYANYKLMTKFEVFLLVSNIIMMVAIQLGVILQ